MDNQTFKGYNCDLIGIQNKISTYFVGRNYRITNFHKGDIYLTAAYKRLLGNKTVVAKIQGNPAVFDVSIGLSERITDINSIQLPIKIPLEIKMLLTEPFLENNFLNYVSTQVELSRNTFNRSFPIPPPPPVNTVWREKEVIREIEVVYCRYCGAKNNARLLTCAKCSAGLH